MQFINICGVRFHNISSHEMMQDISDFIKERHPVSLVTPNVDHVVRYQKDGQFRAAVCAASLVLVDGVPLMWAAQILGSPLKEKLSGSDLLPKLCEEASHRGWKVFFLGGREGAAMKSAEILKQRFPALKISGVICPVFGFEKDIHQNDKVIAAIKEASPDIIFVGLGSPKQENWIAQFKDVYATPVSIGIGAGFDFISGMVKRAPLWMQSAGLEWFWRLLMEPQRLWKRYLIDDVLFLWLFIRQMLKKNEGVK